MFRPRASQFSKMAGENGVLSLEQKSKLILENRKNSNYLVDLLELLDSEDQESICAAIICLERVFKVFVTRRLWHEESRPENGLNENGEDGGPSLETTDTLNEDPERVYASWLHEKYLLFVKTILQLFSHEVKEVRKKSLDCLMQLLLADYEAKLSSPNYDAAKPYFPNTLFARIVSGIIIKNANNKCILKAFYQYLNYSDIQFYTLKNINKIINTKLGKKENRKYAICDILLKITSGKDADDSEKLFIKNHPDKDKFSWQSKEKGNVFSNTWLGFLQTPLPHEILKKVLVNLHKDVMPYMEDPKLLIDFLTDAYNIDGPVALLALNGLFILIQQYNLDYPDFFKKLYNLVNAEAFDLKYRERFFVLADLFLTSTNLTGYMVAAFVKRFARLSLTATPDGIKISLVLIENLMKRHPSCRVLIHRKQKTTEDISADQKSDPYNHEEVDPAKCNAIKSSLWELKTLEQHYHPDIQNAVKVFQKPFNKGEKEIADYLAATYGSIFQGELVGFDQEEEIPLAFKSQKVMFGETIYDRDIWSFE